jgi:hypothetical protein
MAIFTSTEQLNEVMERLWNRIKADPGMSEQLLKSKLTVRFYYREPEGRLTLDCSDGKEMKIFTGDNNVKPVVEMFMKSDIAHEFWLGRVNVPVAILSGKIVSKGPVQRALSLLPVVKPAYAMYPEIFESIREEKAG